MLKSSNKPKSINGAVLLLICGMILLANPFWELADLLPDLLAWLCIWFGLRTFAELNENMTSARKTALYLMGVEALKMLLWFFAGDSMNRTDSMLATLVFCAAEAACALLFFRSFLTGSEELSRLVGCDRMYLKVENMRFLCALFIFVRAAGNFLPELTAIPELYLQKLEVQDEELYMLLLEFAGAKEMLMLLCFAAVLILAVVWLVSYLPFLRFFRKEPAFASYFNEYLNTDTREKWMRQRFSNLHMARICFAVGAVFVLDLQFDGVRVLPLFGFPAFFALGCFFLDRFAEKKNFRLPILLGACASVLLLSAELYRRCCTVWDARVFSEIDIATEAGSAVWMLVCMTLLFFFWLLFADRAETLSSSFKCGALYFQGLPYWLLTAYALAQSVIYILPFAAGTFNVARLILGAAFWYVVNRRLAAFEEQAHKSLTLGMV